MSRVGEVEGLKRSMLVRARLLQWRLRSRRRPPARWFGGGGTGAPNGRDQAAAASSSSRVPPSNPSAAAFIDNDYPAPPKLNVYVRKRKLSFLRLYAPFAPFPLFVFWCQQQQQQQQLDWKPVAANPKASIAFTNL